jgi:predicted transcriptional regulator
LLVVLRKWPAMWLGGAVMLALLLPLADVAACTTGEEGPTDKATATEGNPGPRSVVVISDSTNITLALGDLEGALEPFPDMGTGAASFRVDTPLDLSGQLVDGTYTLLSYGGGREAARRNHGVAGHGEQIRWWFAGQEQTPVPVSWRSPDDSDSSFINGTFFIRNWLPDPALFPAAGTYEMRFNFSGTRVHYPGWGEFQIYPPAELRLDVGVVYPTETHVLEPSGSADAGTTVTIRGEARSADGLRPDGGIVVSAAGRTLGPPMPGGLYLDDVAVTIPGIPTTVFREGFETPSAAWSHGGEPDDWEAGTPAGGTSAYAELRCLCTGLDGSYSHMADEWTETPSIDLSGYQADAQLSFAVRSELRTGDYAELRVWNGSDWSDSLRIQATDGSWQVRTVDLGILTCRGRPFHVAGTDELRIRFRLKSLTPSAPVKDGAFALDWAIPADIAPGPQFLTFKFFPDGPYATSFAYLKVDVASTIRFVLADSYPRLGADGWAELDARLVDGRGLPPDIPMGRFGGPPLRVFWDDGAGNVTEVESVTAPNLTGWFAAAHRIPAATSLEGAAFVIRFDGTERYQPAQMRVNCTVLVQPRLELDETPPAVRGGNASVGGTLMLGERPVALGELTLTLPFAPYRLTLTTDDSGRFGASVTVPAGWPNDSFSVDALAIPGKGMLPASASAGIAVMRLLHLRFDGQTLEKGSAVETVIDTLRFNGFAGRVEDETGRPAAGVEVVVEAIRGGGREPLGRTFTGPTGYFSLPHVVGWSEMTGDLVVRATAVSPPSPTASAEATFTVCAGTILVMDEPPLLRPGGYANLSGMILEDRAGAPGEPVRDARVTIDFGGRKYDALTDQLGRFRVRCAVAQSEGNVSISASYAGNGAAGASSSSLSASVAGTAPEAKITLPESIRPAPATTAVAAGSAFLAALGMALIAGTEIGRVKLLVALAPLYSKIRKEEVLDQFVRGQVFGYIQANPGDHYSSIRQTLRLKNGTLAYHLRTLERGDFIFSRMDGIYRRYYPSGADPARIQMRGNLKETHKRMLELVEASPGITPKELAVKLGTSHQVASYHIRLLARRGRIRLETMGRNTLCFPAIYSAGGGRPS